MNDQDRHELEELSNYQKQLQGYLNALEGRIADLRKRVEAAPVSVPPPPPQEALRPIPKPSELPVPPQPAKPAPFEKPRYIPSPAPEPASSPEASTPPEPIATPEAIVEDQSDSFEMRVGTYWLVRIGIVLMLTSAVFFGRQYFSELSALAKIVVLYLAGAATLGLGYWLERSRESLKNFGRVLMAGGFAGIYYTTYAAHYVEALRVIQNPLVAGALLLGWAGVMVGVADRKKSQTLAFFAVLLAYYTSIINEIAYFTLFSNLILTAAAVFFLVRHRWAGITFASLILTYLSYGFWRFYHDGAWAIQLTTDQFWMGTAFLAGYWALFTSAVFLSRQENFSGGAKGLFLTLNNGALFTHLLLTLPEVYPGSFWKFCLIFGAALLGLAMVARGALRDDPAVKNSYSAQGLILITLAIMTYFTGKTLALVLAAESVALIVSGYQLQSRVLRGAAYLLAPFAVLFGLAQIKQFEAEGLWMGIAVGAAMAFCGWWAKRQTLEHTVIEFQPKPFYFCLLALLIWFFTTWANTTTLWRAPVLALEAVVLTLSIYALRMPELSFAAQFYLLVAQLTAIGQLDSKSVPWWNPLIPLGATLGLSHWWQRQQILLPGKRADHVFQGLYAIAAVAILYFWMAPQFRGEAWVMVTSLAAVTLLIYGAATRAWYLAALGQFFILVGVLRFCGLLLDGHPSWYAMLVPIFAMLGMALGARSILLGSGREFQESDRTILAISSFYRWVAFALSICWAFEYVPAREQFWAFILAGFVLHLWGAAARCGVRLAIGSAFTTIALFILLITYSREQIVYLPNLLACLLLLAQQQLGKRLFANEIVGPAANGLIIVAGLASLWVYVSCWALLEFKGFSLTASWGLTALAAFAAGFILRERAYRLTGLAILACALVRIFVVDIWELEIMVRWLTAFILGAVCIALSFVYNRYRETIKSWL